MDVFVAILALIVVAFFLAWLVGRLIFPDDKWR